MPEILSLDDRLHCIDLRFQGQPGVIAAYLLEDAGEYALIETGPTSTLDTLLAALKGKGVDPAEIGKLLVTHIHLDHAGASGTFMRLFPRAKLFVHEIGVPHMIDPSKLVASATRIYGDMMGPLWGKIDPVPPDRITALRDGDTIRVGNRNLKVLYTPGHASHHVAFHDPERSLVFTGDAAAVRLQGHDFVRPPTPPPDIDLEVWSDTFTRLQALRAETLCLTHFGPFHDADRHLHDARERLFAWGEIVRRAAAAGQTQPELTATLRRHGDAELLREDDSADTLLRYELATPYGMSVDGYLRYFRRRSRA